MSSTEISGFKVVIPSRFGSTRFPGKVLAEIAGKPMLAHAYDRAVESGADDIQVAGDDSRIADFCSSCNIPYVDTRPEHNNGTERIAEVVEKLDWSADTVIVGLQCDEPATPPVILKQVADNLLQQPAADIATLCSVIDSAAVYHDPNRVKVVTDVNGYALYFSRAPIPWRRDSVTDSGSTNLANADENDSFPRAHVHIGMHAYRAPFLKAYTSLAETRYENEEKLEQLRALGHGFKIHVDEANAPPSHGVDIKDDLAEAERALLELLKAKR